MERLPCSGRMGLTSRKFSHYPWRSRYSWGHRQIIHVSYWTYWPFRLAIFLLFTKRLKNTEKGPPPPGGGGSFLAFFLYRSFLWESQANRKVANSDCWFHHHKVPIVYYTMDITCHNMPSCVSSASVSWKVQQRKQKARRKVLVLLMELKVRPVVGWFLRTILDVFFTDFFLGHRSEVSVFLRARNHQAKSPKGPSSHGTIAMLRSHGFDQ